MLTAPPPPPLKKLKHWGVSSTVSRPNPSFPKKRLILSTAFSCDSLVLTSRFSIGHLDRDGINDGSVNSRHTGENRCPVFYRCLKSLDSGFRRNDDLYPFLSFQDFII